MQSKWSNLEASSGDFGSKIETERCDLERPLTSVDTPGGGGGGAGQRAGGGESQVTRRHRQTFNSSRDALTKLSRG